MKFQTARLATTIGASLLVMTLNGCLSKEEPESAAGDTNSVAQNNAPTISGSPQTAVTIGSTYSFTPSASDVDGDRLVFSIQNTPSWATFDTSTGTLSGTPTLANVGTYQDVQIAVSDNTVVTYLPQFSVDVIQAAPGSVTLTWTPPTQYEDGTPLSDLSAYNIYYGTDSGAYTRSIRIDTAGIASFVVEDLVPDTYYFVATAVNEKGVESGFSNETIRQIL